MGKFTFVVVIMMALAAGLHASEDLEVAWQDYLSRFPMGVQTKAEYGHRKFLFGETHARIAKHNSNAAAPFKMEHNEFSTMTEDEKQARLGGMKPERPTLLRQISSRQLPTSIDYRTDACLPKVRNQGGCGSCWTFSATAVVEFGKCKKAGGTARDLSEQQLVDCSRVNGCSGGWEHEAWKYLSANGGQATESSYAYTAKNGTCRFSTSTMSIGAKVSSSAYVEWVGTVDKMKTVLASGRILSIYMQLPSTFFNYKSGVFYDTNCVANNAHAMNVVGYGALSGVDYWVVRNSWGSGWGAAGYVLVRRGVDLCMIEYYSRTTNIV
ncbi:ervatamin-B-like [Daphnia pulex]|uniref:ervatamin-B-like n=1 Tax=Daphnia pulex TaxID=6669 RepID=UPI001EE128EF|nr:ervatamin-B-like [Daphnia pulex]